MEKTPDKNEIGRKANELAAEFGLGAHRHARGLAKQAEADGKPEDAAFWTAVADQLSPRCSI